MTTNSDAGAHAKDKAAQRAERLAAELRENLKRRKARSRALASRHDGPAGDAAATAESRADAGPSRNHALK